MTEESSASARELAVKLIDSALDRMLSFRSDDVPDQLKRSMRYSVLSPGKRLRPLLCLHACEACGGTAHDALPAACATELVHAFSLIHDDLPAMDDDDLRRGQPTNHKVFGEDQAILAGDALLSFAFDVLAREIRDAECGRECMLILARATGPMGMTGGQSQDMTGLVNPSATDIERMHLRKTGALIDAAVHMGAVCADADSDSIIALRTYATHLGLAFQITDDILDCVSTQKEAGKSVSKDAQQGKSSYVAVLGLDASRRRAEEELRSALSALDSFDGKADPLRRIVEAMAVRRT